MNNTCYGKFYMLWTIHVMASSISIGPVPVMDSVMTNKLMDELNLLLTRECSIFVICMYKKRLQYDNISTLKHLFLTF
jgi:hypothetical protein